MCDKFAKKGTSVEIPQRLDAFLLEPNLGLHYSNQSRMYNP